VVEVTRELTDATGDPRYVAALAVAEPVLECATVMDLLSRLVLDDITDGDTLRLLGMAAHAIGDTVRSVDFLAQAEALLREQGRLGLLSHVLSMQVIDRLELGDWDRASAAAAEGERLARETGQTIWRPVAAPPAAGHAGAAAAALGPDHLRADRRPQLGRASPVRAARGRGADPGPGA
jgi:hypothetical protein